MVRNFAHAFSFMMARVGCFFIAQLALLLVVNSEPNFSQISTAKANERVF